MSAHEHSHREEIRTAIKKASGLLSKVGSMVEKESYCIDVMQQNLAVSGLLRSVHRMLMEDHLRTCFRSAMESQNEKKKKQMIDEILKVMAMYNK